MQPEGELVKPLLSPDESSPDDVSPSINAESAIVVDHVEDYPPFEHGGAMFLHDEQQTFLESYAKGNGISGFSPHFVPGDDPGGAFLVTTTYVDDEDVSMYLLNTLRGLLILFWTLLGARWPYSFILQLVVRQYMIDQTHLNPVNTVCKDMAQAGLWFIVADFLFSYSVLVIVLRHHLRYPFRLAMAYEVFRGHLLYRIYILLVATFISFWFALIAIISIAGWPNGTCLKYQFTDVTKETISSYPNGNVCGFTPDDVTYPVIETASTDDSSGGGGSPSPVTPTNQTDPGGGGSESQNYFQWLLSAGLGIFQLGANLVQWAQILSSCLPFFTRPIPLLFSCCKIGCIPALTFKTVLSDIHVKRSATIPRLRGIGFWDFVWNNSSSIVAKVMDALLLVNSASDVEKLSLNSSLTHYYWSSLERLSTDELARLKRFLFLAGYEEPSGWYERSAIFCVPLCKKCCCRKNKNKNEKSEGHAIEEGEVEEEEKEKSAEDRNCCFDFLLCCKESPIRSGLSSCLYLTFLLLTPFLGIIAAAASSVTQAYEWIILGPMLIFYVSIGPCLGCCTLCCVSRCCTCFRNEIEVITGVSLLKKSRIWKILAGALFVLFFFAWYDTKTAWALQFASNCNSDQLFNFSRSSEDVNIFTPLFGINYLVGGMGIDSTYNISGLTACGEGHTLYKALHQEYCLGYSSSLLSNPYTLLYNNLVFFPFVGVAFLVILSSICSENNNASRGQMKRLYSIHKEGKRLPSLNIPPITLLANRDTGSLLRNALIVLQLIPAAKDVKRLKQIPLYRYLYLQYVANLTDEEMDILRRFFFPWQFGEDGGDRSSCLDWIYENDPPCLCLCYTTYNCIRGVYRNKESVS